MGLSAPEVRVRARLQPCRRIQKDHRALAPEHHYMHETASNHRVEQTFMSAVISSKMSGLQPPEVRIRARIYPCRTMPSPTVILSAARGSYATEGKSKDPDNASSAMPIQGILPIPLPCRPTRPNKAAPRQSRRNKPVILNERQSRE
jgi:hypothetical protein